MEILIKVGFVIFALGLGVIIKLYFNKSAIIKNLQQLEILGYKEINPKMENYVEQIKHYTFLNYRDELITKIAKLFKEQDAFVTSSIQAALKQMQVEIMELKEVKGILKSEKPKEHNEGFIERPETFIESEEEQATRATERLHRLLKLSSDLAEKNNEYEHVPAYIRRNMELFGNNKLTSVEDFYKKYISKETEDEKQKSSNSSTNLQNKKKD